MDEQEQPRSGAAGVLSSRIGPLAAWQWMALVTLAALAYYVLVARKRAQQQPPVTPSVPSQDVPQFVIQNQLYPPSAPSTGSTTPNPSGSTTTPHPTGSSSSPSKSTPSPTGHTVTVTKWTKQHTAWSSTISGIASHFGIRDWHQVWNAPQNAGLRAKRRQPEKIQPGDQVYVPAAA